MSWICFSADDVGGGAGAYKIPSSILERDQEVVGGKDAVRLWLVLMGWSNEVLND